MQSPKTASGSKPPCATTKHGFQIKIALSQIDQWVYSLPKPMIPIISKITFEQTRYTRSACLLLVTATNESMFTTKQIILETFNPLSLSQIAHLLSRFQSDKQSDGNSQVSHQTIAKIRNFSEEKNSPSVFLSPILSLSSISLKNK